MARALHTEGIIVGDLRGGLVVTTKRSTSPHPRYGDSPLGNLKKTRKSLPPLPHLTSIFKGSTLIRTTSLPLSTSLSLYSFQRVNSNPNQLSTSLYLSIHSMQARSLRLFSFVCSILDLMAVSSLASRCCFLTDSLCQFLPERKSTAGCS